MRVWDLAAGYLNRQSLLGEHRELHGIYSIITENKAGYARSDILNRIDHLKPGSLLLLHGMADDNVIFENSTRLMAALQKQAIPFEMALYPGERHSAPGSKTKGLSVLKTHLEFFGRKLKGQ